jgi:uncharacterized YccA/Bax inhibitor family protein
MEKSKSWKTLFAGIDTREKAEQTVREAAKGFFIVAALQGGIGIFMAPAMLIDAALFAVLGGILLKWKSRTAAVLLLILSGMSFVVTILNRMGVMAEGGTNILLALIVTWVAVRAVEATFKLRGRFKQEKGISGGITG